MFVDHYLHAEHHGWGEYPNFIANVNETRILLINIPTLAQYHSNPQGVLVTAPSVVAFPIASAATRSCSCCSSLSGGPCQLHREKYLSSSGITFISL